VEHGGRHCRGIAAGRTSALNVVEATLTRIRARDPELNSFTAVTERRALAHARALDEARAHGKSLPPLAGVPFAVKNLFDIAGLPTLAGSKINREAAPARRDAALIARLEAAGAVLVGALNMGEYAYDFTGENAHDGPSRNPHDLDRMTGGSSGGSAAAVAGGLVPIALASDTNGSIRVPASLCGLFGLKPTYGRLSCAGTFPFVTSLDHVGPLARSVRDLALAYDAMQGHDAADPVSARRAVEPVPAGTTTWATLGASKPAGARAPASSPTEASTATGSTMSSSRRISLAGLLGLSGTATAPALSTPR